MSSHRMELENDIDMEMGMTNCEAICFDNGL